MASFRPLSDKVLVRRDPPMKTIGGIHIPSTAYETQYQGTVVDVGPGRWSGSAFRTVDLEPGDRVVFASNTGLEVYIEDEEFLVLSDSEVIGVIREI
jgi:chaperonin GroES